MNDKPHFEFGESDIAYDPLMRDYDDNELNPHLQTKSQHVEIRIQRHDVQIKIKFPEDTPYEAMNMIASSINKALPAIEETKKNNELN